MSKAKRMLYEQYQTDGESVRSVIMTRNEAIGQVIRLREMIVAFDRKREFADKKSCTGGGC